MSAVAKRLLRLVMNFYDKSVCSGDESGFGHRRYERAYARRVAWISDNRQMGQLFEHRYGG